MDNIKYEYNQWSPILQPSLNGGLFQGQPFIKDAPWATVPVRPTSAYMTHINLRSANPPPGAIYQMQAGYRQGNNSDDLMPGVMNFTGNENFGPFNFACIPCQKKEIKKTELCNKCPIKVIPII